MYKAPQSTTSTMTLEQVISKLSANNSVDGILTVGSINANRLVPASDYDLVIVFSALPVPSDGGFTFIDGRMTDLIFTTAERIKKIVAFEGKLETGNEAYSIARFLQKGSIVYDRSGDLKKAQDKLQTGDWFKPITDSPEGYCCGINFNYQHNKRMMESDDPVYQIALDLRFLYNTIYMFWWYFEMRNIPWDGEKSAVRYLQQHDPDYLELFQKFMAETDRRCKFNLYEKIASKTAEPVGGLWEGMPTAFGFDSNINKHSDNVAKAHAFWENLLGMNNA